LLWLLAAAPAACTNRTWLKLLLLLQNSGNTNCGSIAAHVHHTCSRE
jgi:hypothetical protein